MSRPDLMISVTTSTLLEHLLRSHDGEVWREFDERYRPVLLGVALRLGMSRSDADDVAQDALLRFLKSFRAGGYDRSRGRLRSWLIGIMRNCIADFHRRARRRREQQSVSVGALPDDNDVEALWDAEVREVIVKRALRRLREDTRLAEQTILAFTMVVFQQQTPQEVANTLGISLDSVYAAKNRCARQLREIVAELDESYEIT